MSIDPCDWNTMACVNKVSKPDNPIPDVTSSNLSSYSLQPDTDYTIVVISQYGEFKSRTVPLIVKTGMFNAAQCSSYMMAAWK